LDSKNFLEIVGILYCYSLAAYKKTKENKYISIVIFIHNFKKITGLSEGYVSAKFMEDNNIKIYSMGIGSIDTAKEQILLWAKEITSDNPEITDSELRQIVRSHVRTL
jgi:hypothetical protein